MCNFEYMFMNKSLTNENLNYPQYHTDCIIAFGTIHLIEIFV